MKKQKGINCLPIFLTGCQSLLIVAGPTYCSRLWCVMEIFTFLRMGGARERIELRLIANPGQNQAAAKKELAAQLAAECYSPVSCANGSASDGHLRVRSYRLRGSHPACLPAHLSGGRKR